MLIDTKLIQTRAQYKPLSAGDGFNFMANDKSNKALVWIAGALVVLLSGGFAYKKYIDMRMAGASGGDAFLFMVMVFVGIIAVIGIAGGFIYYYMIPEGRNIHKGLKNLKKKEPISMPEAQTAVESEKLNHDEEIQRQEAELKRQREELFSLLSSYAKTTFRKVLSPSQIDALNSNIRKFAEGDDDIVGVETTKSEFVTPIDLYHFAWNIAIRLIANDKTRKFRICTASFVKDTFQITFADHAVTTIASKLTTTDGKYSLRRVMPDGELTAHVFPGSEDLAIKSD